MKLRTISSSVSALKEAGQRSLITFAIRKKPGIPYDTYYSYFLDSNDDWQVYGVGRTYNKQMTLSDLWVGSFVEVPGTPSKQRTGHQERIIGYNGWLVDQEKKVFKIDRLVAGGTREGVNKRWGSMLINNFLWVWVGWMFEIIRLFTK